VALERLGVVAAVGPTGGVPDVADGRPAGILGHDAFGLGRVVQPERLDNGADLLVRVEDLLAGGVEGREPGRELAAVLQVEQDARHESTDLVRGRGTGEASRWGEG